MKYQSLILTILFFFFTGIELYSQNIVITDDDAYSANSSAMLDVKSVTKGLLIPRVTTSQRNAIVSPANSLLVFDLDISAFFYWTGASWSRIGTASSDYWLPDGANIYFTAGNVGVGTSSPGRKMIVKGSSANLNEAIFAVQNTDGDTVFAVYPEGVRVWVNDDGGSKASGSRGGFAVGGYSPSKAGFTNEYLRVTPDSVRVYIDDDYTGSKASGNRGGFAVGGFNPSKGSITDDYLFVQDDSTRVWTNGAGGFEIADLSAGSVNYMDLTPDNYFIGHQSGISNTSGTRNSFLGYQSGLSNLIGSYNTFIGYQSGYSNTDGQYNTFLGYRCGYLNTSGTSNVFLGKDAGYTNSNGSQNIFLGNETGFSNTTGSDNIFIGPSAGRNGSTAGNNLFIGIQSGFSNETGHSNVFLGNMVGYTNTSGYKNVFIGDRCGYSNTTGYQNIFIGDWAGVYNTTGSSNCYIGYQSGYNNTGGSYNTFLGYQSGRNNSTGEYNTYIGYRCGFENTIGTHNVFIGFDSGSENTEGSSNVFIGHMSGISNTTGWSNNFIGQGAGYLNTTGTNNIFIGNNAGHESTVTSGNIFIGRDCGYHNTTGYGNLYMGNNAGQFNKDGSGNVILGYSAMPYDTVGGSNVAVGSNAGYLNNAGEYNTYLGTGAGYANNGSENVFLGYNAGYNEAGSDKLYIANSSDNTPLIYGDFSSNNIVINGDFKVTGLFYDDDGDAGLAGQVFSSTGTGSDWINLPASLSGTGTSTEIAFWTGSTSLGSNSNLYWDNVNYRLGIGSTPTYKLHVIDNTSGDLPAIYGIHAVINNYGIGLEGKGGYMGVKAENTSTTGINYGVNTSCTGSGGSINYGIYSSASGASTNYAGYFQGNVHVNGTLSKSAGTFKIDHPQDPENKYLIHSFVESPDMKNVYDGIAVFDASGKSTVILPGYFEALNRDFRYQLTTIGAYAPVYIDQEIQNGQFVIAGGVPGMKVSWQITGIRKDPYAIQNPVIVEQEKNISEKGLYLNPELYNKSNDKFIYKANEK